MHVFPVQYLNAIVGVGLHPVVKVVMCSRGGSASEA